MSKSTSTILDEDLTHLYIKVRQLLRTGVAYLGNHLCSTINRDLRTIQEENNVKKYKTYLLAKYNK